MTTEPAAAVRHFTDAFANPEAVAHYADRVARFVPGYDSLHRMTGVLLAETAPKEARVLVLGAGGGLELRALADMHPRWTFVGVDPSPAMLDLARATLGHRMERVELVEGFVDDAPPGPFDAAVSLLTLHFLEEPERRRTVSEMLARLRPGSPCVVAHASFPQAAAERGLWLDRYLAYAVASGGDPAQAKTARDAIEASTGITMLDPARDEAILVDGGLRDPKLFYAAFTWRGWVGRA